MDEVRRLADWINEIYRFELDLHLKMVEKDLQILIDCDESIIHPHLSGREEDPGTELDKCDYHLFVMPALIK